MKITDAQVRAVWDALGPKNTIHIDYEDLRSALEAALDTETPVPEDWDDGAHDAYLEED